MLKQPFHFVPPVFLACFMASVACAATVTIPFVPTGLSLGDRYQVAFVTGGMRDAASTSISDYNDFVRNEAERTMAITENWQIEWFALGSTFSIDARDNAVVSAPVYLLSDVLIATGFSDMWDGSIASPLQVDQFANVVGTTLVWTGTEANGTGIGFDRLGPPSARVGRSESSSESWVADALIFESDARFPVYALSEVLTAVPEPSTLGTCMLLSVFGMSGSFGRRKRR